MQEAILLQKIEFLEIELEECKRREDQLKSTNQSLMQMVGSDEPGLLRDYTTLELQKSNQQYMKDLQSLKKRFKQTQSTLESKNRELTLANKELSLDLKQQKVAFESEKYELLAKVQRLEGRNLSLEKSLRQFTDHDKENLPVFHGKDDQESTFLKKKIRELEEKLHEFKGKPVLFKELEQEKEKLLQEIENLKTSVKQYQLELSFIDQKRNENEKALKNEIKFLIGKLQQARSGESFRNDRLFNTGKSFVKTECSRPQTPINASMTTTSSQKLSERYSSALRPSVLTNY